MANLDPASESERARAEFERMLLRPESALELAHAALLIAVESDPQVDVQSALGQLEIWADELKARLDPGWNNLQKLARLRNFLFEELGFRGDRTDYFSPSNSLLHEVIQRRRGIPLTLAIIMMELGWRIGMPFEGVGFPGHFLVRLTGEPGDLLLDPFQRGMSVHEEDCRHMLKEITRGEVEFNPEMLASVNKRQMIVRLLHNLKASYVRAGANAMALAVVERLILVDAEDRQQHRDLGLLLFRLQRFNQALDALQRYRVIATDDHDRAEIDRTIEAVRDRLSSLN